MVKDDYPMWAQLWQRVEQQTNVGWLRQALSAAGWEIRPAPGGYRAMEEIAAASGAYPAEEAQRRAVIIGAAAEKLGYGFAPKNASQAAVVRWAPVTRPDGPGGTPHAPYDGDVGLDLVCQIEVDCQPGQTVYIPQGVRFGFPPGVWGLVVGRSSALRLRGLTVHPAVIDTGYTGEIEAAVTPIGMEQVAVEAGARICQLVLMAAVTGYRLEQVDDLEPTHRGGAGFGSSGA